MKTPTRIHWMIMGFSVVLFLLVEFNGIIRGETLMTPMAIKGYDTVAYFKAGKAIKGNESLAFQWHGLAWHFSTKENKDLFAANPEKYAPQYNGYCAWAMTEARKALTDPEVWKIVHGKLYLNCSQEAYEKWSRDIHGNIEKADANWLKLNSKD